jgi:hypothetical protein
VFAIAITLLNVPRKLLPSCAVWDAIAFGLAFASVTASVALNFRPRPVLRSASEVESLRPSQLRLQPVVNRQNRLEMDHQARVLISTT